MANSKLTGLTATTTPVSTDIFYIVTDPGGTPTSQKVTGANLAKILTAPASSVDLGAAATPFRSAFLSSTSADTVGAQLSLYKNRSGGAITTGDVLGDINFYGDGGGGALLMGRIRSVSTGTIGSTRVPTTLEFYTATNAAPSVLTKALTLGSDRSATFTGFLFLPDGVSPGSGAYSIISSVAPAAGINFNGGDVVMYASGAASVGTTSGSGVTVYDTNGLRFLQSGAAFLRSVAAGVIGVNSSTSSTAWADLKLRTLINSGSANTAYWTGTGYSITGSGTTSMIDLAGTLNTSGVVDIVKVNITNATTSGAGSTFLNFLDTSSSKFSVGVQGNVISAGSFKSGAPSGGTSQAWKLGTVASVTPTSPNRTIEVEVNGTTYYLAAKTTND